LRCIERRVAARLAQELGINFQIAIADRAIDSDWLTPGEREQLARLQTEARRTSWKIGRAALKQLRVLCGEDDDTSGLVFPSPCYSLTHSSGYAVAVGAVSAGLAGIGIDLEFLRPINPKIGQFFLTAHERVWIKGLPAAHRSTELLRLWTIKEALFKSDPYNRGAGLADYALAEPGDSRGQVIIRRGAVMVMQYVCYALGPGMLSVAVAHERSGHDQ
jgi:4'-phosphopantetheinyl transferase EntD